ncbi:alpha/beta hydrolase [Bacillus sp. FSL W7-1360]
MKRRTKIWLWVVAITFTLVLAALFTASWYMYNMAVAREAKHVQVYAGDMDSPDDDDEVEARKTFEEMLAMFEQGRQWLRKQPTEEMEQQSFDGLVLRASYLQNEVDTGKVAVLLHGYRGDREEMGLLAQMYLEQGYDVFLPDARGHGQSEGDYVGFGWHERLDQSTWIQQLIAEKGAAQIVIHGQSMGAATALMTAGEDLPDQVKAVIADSAYTSVKEELAHQMQELFHVPRFPLLDLSSMMTYFRAGYTFGEASTIAQVEKDTPPLFLIHGDQDVLVPTEMAKELYEAANGRAELWVVPGANHVGSMFAAPDAYHENVWAFLSQHVEM